MNLHDAPGVGFVLARVPIPTVSTDALGRVCTLNEAAERMFGLAREDVCGRHTLDRLLDATAVVPHGQAKAAEPPLDALLGLARRGSDAWSEWTVTHADGHRMPVRLWCITARVRPDAPPEHLFFWRDQSTSRRQTERLLETELRHQAVVDAAPLGVITADGHGLIDSVNGAATRLLGYRADEMIGQGMTRFVTDTYRHDVDAFVNRRLRPRAGRTLSVKREIEVVRRDDSTFPAELSVSEYWVDGQRRFTVMLSDLSERAAERAKNEFIATVSHELRTPLTSIRGALGLLEAGKLGALPPQADQLVRIARANADRLKRLVDDILDISKVEMGRLEIHVRPVAASALLRDAVGAMESLADGVGVGLRVTEEATGDLLADADRVAQVFGNLVGNAIKFSPPGGEVHVVSTGDDERIRFTVIDQGRGIEGEDMARLFRRFERLDSSDARSHGGTGLGLAISKAIVEQHGGRIGVESQVSVGSRFWFELPRLRRGAGAAWPDATPARRALVVEDDPECAGRMCRLLADAGWTTHLVGTLTQARDALDGGAWEALLVDTALPDGSGLDLLDGLGHGGATPIPVVVLASAPPLRTDLQRTGVVDWLVKPFEPGRLRAVLDALVSGRAPRTVLLIEEDAATRDAVARALRGLGIRCLPAVDGAIGLTLARTERPDLVLLDIGTLRPNGFEVVDILRETRGLQSTTVIAHVSRTLTQAEQEDLTLGALVVVPRGGDLGPLLDAVRASLPDG